MQHNNDSWHWHARYGHISVDALHQLGRQDMVRGLPRLEHVEQLCNICVMTKHRQAPFPAKVKYRAEGILDLVHSDICGPITPATPGERRYFLLLVDDASRYMWLALLTAKSDAAAAITKFQAAAEVESGHKLRVLRTDNGGEFTSVEFARHCEDHGVQRHFSAPYTPQQNGVVERRNQTILATARALLKQRKMPAEF
jgi:transposase InsO family protein